MRTPAVGSRLVPTGGSRETGNAAASAKFDAVSRELLTIGLDVPPPAVPGAAGIFVALDAPTINGEDLRAPGRWSSITDGSEQSRRG